MNAAPGKIVEDLQTVSMPRIETYESRNAPENRRWTGNFVQGKQVLPTRFFARDEVNLIGNMTEFWKTHAAKRKPIDERKTDAPKAAVAEMEPVKPTPSEMMALEIPEAKTETVKLAAPEAKPIETDAPKAPRSFTNTVWVHKSGEKPMRVPKDDLDGHIAKGWLRGLGK